MRLAAVEKSAVYQCGQPSEKNFLAPDSWLKKITDKTKLNVFLPPEKHNKSLCCVSIYNKTLTSPHLRLPEGPHRLSEIPWLEQGACVRVRRTDNYFINHTLEMQSHTSTLVVLVPKLSPPTYHMYSTQAVGYLRPPLSCQDIVLHIN